MKLHNIIYWISTGLMCLIFLFSATMYIFSYESAAAIYENLGFPTWLIYPSAIAKILGVIAILSKKSNLLKEWAYAGFFFDTVLAFSAHTIVDDGGGSIAMIALVATIISRFFEDRVFSS